MHKRKRSNVGHGDVFLWANSPVSTLATDIFGFPFNHVLDDTNTPLCELMCKYGSDKGAGWHNYTKLYHYLLNKKQVDVKNVFEVGLGTNFLDVTSSMGASGKPGASLRAWRDYFPHAFIRGADIDRRILFEEDRISTYYCDQSNPEDILTLWKTLPNIQYDLIIDDGWHDFLANKIFLENSLHQLTNNGLYVVEDVFVNNHNFINWQNFLRTLSMQSVIVKIPNKDNQIDNCLVLLAR